MIDAAIAELEPIIGVRAVLVVGHHEGARPGEVVVFPPVRDHRHLYVADRCCSSHSVDRL
jgi:hypothetical protein